METARNDCSSAGGGGSAVVVESRGSAVLVAEEVEPYSIGRYKGRGEERREEGES
jgi:hypothetical protein